MGLHGNLASADEPISCGSKAAEESVSGLQPEKDAPQAPPTSNADVSSKETAHSGLQGNLSPDHCGKTPPVLERDGLCIGHGGECQTQSEAAASNLGREALSEVGVLQNGNEMALQQAMESDCLNNSSDKIEDEDGICRNEPLVKGIKTVEETADDLLFTEAGCELNAAPLDNGDECCGTVEATIKCKVIPEEVLVTPSTAMNDQMGGCLLETCADPEDGNVNYVAQVDTDTLCVTQSLLTSELPAEIVLSSVYLNEKSNKHEDKSVSGITGEAVEEAVEANHVIVMENPELPSNETVNAAGNLCPAYSPVHAVMETVQEDDKSVKCLSSQEVSTEIMKKTISGAKLEVETCTQTPPRADEMPVEEQTVNCLQLNHVKINDDNDIMTRSCLINEANFADRKEADPGRSISPLQETPYEQLSMPDYVRETSEGLCISSLLSKSALVNGGEDSSEVAETHIEHVEEENARLLDNFNEKDIQSLHLREIAFRNCSAKSSPSDDLDIPSVTQAAATSSRGANDYLNEKNDEGRHDSVSESVPKIESPGVITSYSGRCSHVNKSGRKTQAKRASRYSRNESKVAQHHEALELVFKATKKKRTCCSKTPRASTWGVMQNVTQHLEYMDVHGIEPAQKQGSRKVGIGQGSGNQSRDQVGGTSQASKGKVGGSSNRIRLKVKMGKGVVMIREVNTPASLGTFASASCGNSISDGANLTNDVKGKNQLDCADSELDKGKSSHDDPLVNRDPNSISNKGAQDEGGCCDPTQAVENRYLGSETSPDSEVINLIPESQVAERHQEGINGIALDSSKSHATCEDVICIRKGKKKNKVPRQSSSGRKGKSLSESSSSKRQGCKVKVRGRLNSGESIPLSNDYDIAFSKGLLDNESGANTYPGQDISTASTDFEHLKNELLSSVKKEGQKKVKSSKSGREKSGRSKDVISTKSRKRAPCKQKKDSQKSISKSKVKEKFVYNQFLSKAEDHAIAGNCGRDSDDKSNNAASMWTDDTSKLEIISTNLVEQQLPPRNAWVRCDDCHKWRRIAAALADSIEDANISWTCKDNLDKRFGDCSIPQEMSNAAINAELELSDYEDDDYDGNRYCKELKCSRPTVSQQSSFIQIDTNKFLHRSRRTQKIDEVMVCHCRPSLDGKLGCGDECLNRMLNIECVQGTCPCGDLCSNQQFQKRKYANLQWFRCGKKGYGLQLLENVSQGEFIIEYVGEVLDIPAYEERQKNYAAMGHKHFYFMTLNGSEVIDACVKGNLGRFINHSCDPNCRTEKWMVNGEICIGLFAVRDIKKGEELTFDYNYVRVFGAAAKKCVCGSTQCRGFIGGDLQSTETIFQVNSDDEFPEPVMIHENGDIADRFDTAKPTVGRLPVAHLSLEDKSEMVQEFENRDSRSESVSCISQSERSLDVKGRPEKAFLPSKPHLELSAQSKDVRRTPLPELEQKISAEEDSSQLKYTDTPNMSEPPGRPDSDEKWSLEKVRPLVKTSRSSSTVKKGKVNSNLQHTNKVHGMASKCQMVSLKSKKAIHGSSNGRFEAVQEKLNELLDADGGISKRKDATKGYLKLLLLTATSGDSGNSEAIQSNRDLSMILDALLRTKSRSVLMDIVNKNGLRMLHNIMKHYGRDFKRIPILRKLLKILYYLAAGGILTLEHISVGPPCPGMESFTESILSFTEHDDKQVHQIARSFRDTWIPRHLRKVMHADRDNAMSRVRQPSVSATTSSATDNSSIDGGSTSGTRARKRKTRWDSDTNPFLESLKRKEKEKEKEKETNNDEEGPPGFSSPLDNSRLSSTAAAVDHSSEKVQYSRCPFDLVIGQPQERFKSRSPVSYGVPLLTLQQFGTPQAGGSIETWAIAPGMPFQPFPPLPPFPRDRKRRSPPSRSNSDLHSSKNLSPCGNSASLAESEVSCSENEQTTTFKRLKGQSQDMGRTYVRQQKMPPPWVRNCWRNNLSGDSGAVPDEQRSSDNAIECKLGREESNYNQQTPPVPNQHH